MNTKCFGKNQQLVFFKLIFGSKHKQKDFFVENENNEGISQKQNEFKCFCMDLIKEQLSKHWFDLNMGTGLKL